MLVCLGKEAQWAPKEIQVRKVTRESQGYKAPRGLRDPRGDEGKQGKCTNKQFVKH